MRTHYENLQALRGIACLMVVLVHLWDQEVQFGVQTPIFREIQWFGFAGVDLFFVLSGFLITSSNLKNLGRPSRVPGYLFRRLWRIYPMYWVAFAIAFLRLYAFTDGRFLTAEMNDWWLSWLTLSPVTNQGSNRILGQAWTLSYEVMFYLAFAAIMFFPPRLGAGLLCGWATAIGLSLFGPEPTDPIRSHVLGPFVLEFLGGCTIAWLASRGPCRGGRTALIVALVYVVPAAVIVHETRTLPWLHELASQRTRVLVCGLPAVFCVYGFVALEGRSRLRFPRVFHRIGDASYSLYLLHIPVLGVTMKLGYLIPHHRLPNLLWLAGSFAACVAVGLLAYRYVESPLLNLAKRKKPTATIASHAPLKLAA